MDWNRATLRLRMAAGTTAPPQPGVFLAIFLPMHAAAAILLLLAQGAPVSDTLASLDIDQRAGCLTATDGAGYCWGDIGGLREGMYRISGADGKTAVLRSMVPSLWSLCGLTEAGEAACDFRTSATWSDSSTTRASLRSGCGPGACVVPLPNRGELPPGKLRAIARGQGHTCVIAHDARAYCWGKNSMGQLGTGSWAPDSNGSGGAPVRLPVAVTGGHRFAQLSAEEDLTCGLTLERGFIYCWGYGQSGQTGDSAVMTYCTGKLPYPNKPCSSAVPTRVLPESLPGEQTPPNGVRFVDVASGGRLACAVSEAGNAFCWGDNYRCALGRCRSRDSHRARAISIPGRVVQVGAGTRFACARTADRRVFCWGDNTAGQLGSLVSVNAGPDGLPPDYRDPKGEARATAYRDPCFQGGRCSPAAVEVGPGRPWAQLSVGPSQACAFAADDGAVYCWGADGPVLGRERHLVSCINRSRTWADARCQPGPARVGGLPTMVAAPERSQVGATRNDLSSTAVEVSARELRIRFPVDTSGTWGWPVRETDDIGGYRWEVSVAGLDGPTRIGLWLYQRDSAAQSFSSLEELVAAASANLCAGGGMVYTCVDVEVSKRVEDHRIVLGVSDSLAIHRLFGTRPAYVGVLGQTWEHPTYVSDTVPVRYLDPQIPPPDSSTLAEAAQGQRRYRALITSIDRHIGGGVGWGQEELWLAVGDTLPLEVEETQCHYDFCFGRHGQVGDSGWSVADSSIVRLRPCAEPATVKGLRRSCTVAYAMRRGQTVLRVRGLHGASDSIASSIQPRRRVERKVIVGSPVARIRIISPPNRVTVGEPVTFRVRAFDRVGRAVPRVPVAITIDLGPYQAGLLATQVNPVRFVTPGLRLVTAAFRGLVDTAVVRVVEKQK